MNLSVLKQEDIRFYCGVNNKHWNYHEVVPGKYACVAPVCGKTVHTQMLNYVSLPDEISQVLMDSSLIGKDEVYLSRKCKPLPMATSDHVQLSLLEDICESGYCFV